MVTLTLLSNRKQTGYDVCFTLYTECLSSSLEKGSYRLIWKVLTSQQSIWNVPIFIFLLGKFCSVSAKSLNPISMATTASNRKCFVRWKFFMEGDQIRVESIISVTSHLSPSTWFLGRVLIKTALLIFYYNYQSLYENKPSFVQYHGRCGPQ